MDYRLRRAKTKRINQKVPGYIATKNTRLAARFLNEAKIGVLPTDTVYGLMTKALDKPSVSKIYKIKERPANKPLIILISKPDDLLLFGIDNNHIELAKKYWPAPTTVVMPCDNPAFGYLNNFGNSLAFRLPNYQPILDIIKNTGPLVAPSANPSGLKPAISVNQAIEYFGNSVDFYLDLGTRNNPPSKVIDLLTDTIYRS